jgi:nitroimidazol reductase NimA-like FMN-containing flavoprotein (pyridoxamine 5'-phosphate oxidase superfamily)
MSPDLKKTDKTTISRHSERASYDRKAAYAILDEGLIAHVSLDTGQGVIVIPMTYARMHDQVLLHGAVASRWLSSFANGRPIGVCVTLLDGIVLARSAFSHSMNYRSVVAYGNATLVVDEDLKQQAFKALLDHLLPGRWSDTRQPDRKEIAATTVLAMTLNEASVKVRGGPPKDAAKDMSLAHWAGVIPLSLTAGPPISDPELDDSIPIPDYTRLYSRP